MAYPHLMFCLPKLLMLMDFTCSSEDSNCITPPVTLSVMAPNVNELRLFYYSNFIYPPASLYTMASILQLLYISCFISLISPLLSFPPGSLSTMASTLSLLHPIYFPPGSLSPLSPPPGSLSTVISTLSDLSLVLCPPRILHFIYSMSFPLHLVLSFFFFFYLLLISVSSPSGSLSAIISTHSGLSLQFL